MCRLSNPWTTLAAVAALGVVGLTAPAAHAGLSVVPPFPTPVLVAPGVYQWNYNLRLIEGQYITTGDFVTLVDFAGYLGVDGPLPTGWTHPAANGEVMVSTSANGTLPPGVSTDNDPFDPANVDDPNVVNLHFVYKGATIAATAGNVDLGTISILSMYNQMRSDWLLYSIGVGDGPDGPGPDGPSNNRVYTSVPKPGNPDIVHETPEPTTLVLMGLGLPVLGAYRLIRRRKGDA